MAARLRSLLDEDPGRSTCSLLMTGHSADGAVASLLYAHMLAQNTGCEKCSARDDRAESASPPVYGHPRARGDGSGALIIVMLAYR